MIRVRHVLGPLDGAANDISLVAPRIPELLFYAPCPPGVSAPTTAGFMIVGFDQRPEVPWDGQVCYRLDREFSELREHPEYEDMQVGLAVYALVDDEGR